MPSFTTRLGLRKPAAGDNVNVVTDINDSMDKLDAHVGALVCTSSTRPTGTDRFTGRTIFETDTRQFLIWDGSAWDYYAGNFQSTWSTVITGGTAGTATLGNAVINANYMREGHWVTLWFRMTLGSTTSFAASTGSLIFNLPPIPSTMGNQTVLGTGHISDASTGDRYGITVLQEDTTHMSFLMTRNSSAIMTNGVPWTWADPDTIRFTARYKVT